MIRFRSLKTRSRRPSCKDVGDTSLHVSCVPVIRPVRRARWPGSSARRVKECIFAANSRRISFHVFPVRLEPRLGFGRERAVHLIICSAIILDMMAVVNSAVMRRDYAHVLCKDRRGKGGRKKHHGTECCYLSHLVFRSVAANVHCTNTARPLRKTLNWNSFG